jgi:hypothetical protein
LTQPDLDPSVETLGYSHSNFGSIGRGDTVSLNQLYDLVFAELWAIAAHKWLPSVLATRCSRPRW